MPKSYLVIKKLVLTLNILFICSLLLSEYAHATVDARYIRIELPGKNRTLSLGEIEVISGNKNIATSGRAIQSTIFNDAVANRAIDSNTSGHYFSNSVSSTQPEYGPWWELDLDKNRPVQKLVIYNRTDCCQERINPANITLYNADRVIVWQGNIKSPLSRYVFELETPTRVAGINLLANASFRQASNTLLPDYWDLHHAAALGIEELYGVYGIDSNVTSPLKDTAVVRIANKDKDFHDIILMSARQYRKLSDGIYTFSIYARSSKPGMTLNVSSGWAIGRPQPFRLTTEWKRYQTTFTLHGQDVVNLQPVLFFPDAGEYFISAPQLEFGSQATAFNNGSPNTDNKPLYELKAHAKMLINRAETLLLDSDRVQTPFFFEYDYYTNENEARLILRSSQYLNSTAGVRCYIADKIPRNSEILNTGLMSVTDTIRLPIAELPEGSYECEVYKSAITGQGNKQNAVLLRKLAVSPFEVKVNTARRTIVVNGKPFFITGIAVGYKRDLPDWYLEDIKARGINTLFINFIPNESGYDASAIQSMLAKVSSYKLHAIVGLPLAGAKPEGWKQKLSRFLELITIIKDNKSIIGWYPIDEPAANTWSDRELQTIYSSVKQLDPYRLVFLNWAYDGIPVRSSAEPLGGLQATDIYSFDYYPFTGRSMSLEGYTEIVSRVQNLAQYRNKPSHTWIQIFGGNDAWREPTPAELRYMVYLNLIYGSMFSYWDTKSNSAALWDELSRINNEVETLADDIFLNSASNKLYLSESDVVYSIWSVGNKLYIIVLNTEPSSKNIEINISSYISVLPRSYKARIYPSDNVLSINNGVIKTIVPGYAGQYFVVDL